MAEADTVQEASAVERACDVDDVDTATEAGRVIEADTGLRGSSCVKSEGAVEDHADIFPQTGALRAGGERMKSTGNVTPASSETDEPCARTREVGATDDKRIMSPSLHLMVLIWTKGSGIDDHRVCSHNTSDSRRVRVRRTP